MNLYRLANGNRDALKKLLVQFYSIPQLQIWLMMLTDSGKIPDMSEQERTERTQAIRDILGIQPPVANIEQPTTTKPVKGAKSTKSKQSLF